MREIKLVEASLEKEIDKRNDAIRNAFLDSLTIYDKLPDWFTKKYAKAPEEGKDYDIEENIPWNNVTPQDWQDLINGKGMEAYNETLMNGFIDLFFQKWCEKNSVDSKAWEDAQSMIRRTIREVGVDEKTNPFLPFIKNYFDNNSKKALNSDDMIAVNNAYANNILDYQDVAGTGHAKINNIIYNPDLYNRDGDEQDELVDLFEKLSDHNYLSKLKLQYIKQQYPDIPQYEKLDIKLKDMEKRNLLMFENGDPRGKILPINQIEGSIQAGLGAEYGENEKRPKDDRREQEDKLNSITKRDIKNRMKSLDKDDLIDVIKSVIKATGLTQDDFKVE